jgi:hypothetical protein
MTQLEFIIIVVAVAAVAFTFGIVLAVIVFRALRDGWVKGSLRGHLEFVPPWARHEAEPKAPKAEPEPAGNAVPLREAS